MCLISQLREPQDVMSADDPSVATAAAEPGSELSSPLPAKNVSLTTSTPHNTKNESSKINVSASNLSLPVSESAESELNLKAKAEDTVSLESEGGELKKENAQSAFAITSVIQGDLDNDDLENNLNPRQPVSLDDSQMKLTESEEDSVSLSEDQRMTASSTEQSGSTAPVVEVAIVTTDGLSSSVTQTQPVNSTLLCLALHLLTLSKYRRLSNNKVDNYLLVLPLVMVRVYLLVQVGLDESTSIIVEDGRFEIQSPLKNELTLTH